MVDDGLNGDYTLPALESDGRLAAFACIGHAQLTAQHVVHLLDLRAAALQGTGVGRMLQAHIEDIVRDGGRRPHRARGQRAAGQRPRRALLSRGGFAEVGRIPEFYRPGDDCVVYCKILAGEGGSR